MTFAALRPGAMDTPAQRKDKESAVESLTGGVAHGGWSPAARPATDERSFVTDPACRLFDTRVRACAHRQLRAPHWKGSVEIEVMRPAEMAATGRTCGWTLARGHARSGDRIAIAGYLGGGTAFDRAMVGFAEAYVDQNERDFAALADAVDEGRVTAERGV